MSRRISRRTWKVLAAFHANTTERHYALDLIHTTGLRSGTLYPILARLERDGWLDSGWDDGPPPRRRWYMLTPYGASEAAR